LVAGWPNRSADRSTGWERPSQVSGDSSAIIMGQPLPTRHVCRKLCWELTACWRHSGVLRANTWRRQFSASKTFHDGLPPHGLVLGNGAGSGTGVTCNDPTLGCCLAHLRAAVQIRLRPQSGDQHTITIGSRPRVAVPAATQRPKPRSARRLRPALGTDLSLFKNMKFTSAPPAVAWETFNNLQPTNPIWCLDQLCLHVVQHSDLNPRPRILSSAEVEF